LGVAKTSWTRERTIPKMVKNVSHLKRDAANQPTPVPLFVTHCRAIASPRCSRRRENSQKPSFLVRIPLKVRSLAPPPESPVFIDREAMWISMRAPTLQDSSYNPLMSVTARDGYKRIAVPTAIGMLRKHHRVLRPLSYTCMQKEAPQEES
jgi:hypothetical protein